MDRSALTEAPPRLVLRFAVLVAVALAVTAAATLFFVRQYAVERAQNLVSFHAAFVANTILRDQLRPADLEQAATGARRGELDRLFRREVLV